MESRHHDTDNGRDESLDRDESPTDRYSPDEEFTFNPLAENEELPALQNIIESLNDGSSELDSHQVPPTLFGAPEHSINYKNISYLKHEVEEEKLHQYVDDFETCVKDDVLMVGQISLEEIQAEERRLRDEHLAFQVQELASKKRQEEELLREEEASKRRVAKELKEERRKLARMVEIAKQKERLELDSVHKVFRREENHLITSMRKQNADIKTLYGDLSLVDGLYAGAKGRTWKLDWQHTPQPIQVKLSALRGVKDKLPGGRYVLMMSLYSRIGGKILKWSELKGQQWGGATMPIIHNGFFYNYQMEIKQSVFGVVPAKPDVKPGMALVFELVLLRGATVQTDRVVAWGCFPLCTSSMDIISGKFKVGMLRGEMDTKIDKYCKIEELMLSDLDHWMCNLYMEVILLPRYMAGQKEFEVELQFSQDLINYSESLDVLHDEQRWSNMKQSSDDFTLNSSTSELPKIQEASSDTISIKSVKAPPDEQSSISTKERILPRDFPGQITRNFRQRPLTTIGSRFAKRDKVIHFDSSSSDEDTDEELMEPTKTSGDSLRPIKGQPGMFYKRYLNYHGDGNHGDGNTNKVYTLLPKTAIIHQKQRMTTKLTLSDRLNQHTASVCTINEGTKRSENWSITKYLARQSLTEIGLADWRSTEFWGMLIVFIITFFLRIQLHYVGQWLLLTAVQTPITSLQYLPYTVQINYRNSLLHMAEAVAVVAVGPLAVFFTFVACVVIVFFIQLALQTFPDIGSKFVLCLGIQSFLDPIFILIIDVLVGSYDISYLGAEKPLADFAHLYWHFWRTEGSGIFGVFITTILYLFIFFVSGSVLYMYFLRLHNNGRMIDLYWRLHSSEKNVFVPHDLEISRQELELICKKADQWRGEEGERRKVTVYEYLWEEEDLDDPTIPVKQEKTTHISIHTVHLDGLNQLYRHFLVLPSGAVVEVFGDNKNESSGERGRNASEVSLESLHPVKGRQTVMTRAGFQNDDDEEDNNSESESSRSLSDTMKKLN